MENITTHHFLPTSVQRVLGEGGRDSACYGLIPSYNLSWRCKTRAINFKPCLRTDTHVEIQTHTEMETQNIKEFII